MIILLHNIRSMHNVGSIFRTSDAIGCVEKIYLCGITPAPVDQFKRERGQIAKVSLGAEKNIPWEKVGKTEYQEETWEQETTQTTLDLITTLKKDGYTILGLEQAEGSIPYDQYAVETGLPCPPAGGKPVPTDRLALILGHEPTGLPEQIVQNCHTILEIPMYGKKESLNVSVAYGIVAYSLIKGV